MKMNAAQDAPTLRAARRTNWRRSLQVGADEMSQKVIYALFYSHPIGN
jgi:hypothetical protein